MLGKIGRHDVHVVGEVLPRAGNSGDPSLSAKTAIGADLASDTGHFSGKGVKLVHHRVDRILQLQDFTFHVHGDLARQVAAGDRGCDLRDVPDLCGEVRREQVHAVGKVLPRARDSENVGLPAEPPFGTDFASHARHFAGEGVELVHHRVDRVLDLQDFTADVDRDLLTQIAFDDGRGYLRDIAKLHGQIARHGVYGIGEVLPGAGHSGDACLTAQLAVCSDFTGNAGDLCSERIQLVHHRVDGVL